MVGPKKISKEKTEIELQPDAWERFERAVKVVAKSPPQHREMPKRTIKRRRAKSKPAK